VGVNVDDRKIDLRVTTLPTQRGEGCSIRILDKDLALRNLDELGMAGEPRCPPPPRSRIRVAKRLPLRRSFVRDTMFVRTEARCARS